MKLLSDRRLGKGSVSPAAPSTPACHVDEPLSQRSTVHRSALAVQCSAAQYSSGPAGLWSARSSRATPPFPCKLHAGPTQRTKLKLDLLPSPSLVRPSNCPLGRSW